MERDPQLKFSDQLLSVPSASLEQRSTAAALWRALTAQSQDVIRDAEKLQALELSIRNLQSQNQSSKLTIEDLNGQVRQARSERYANALVYALGVLLLLSLLGLAYVARQLFLSRSVGANDLPWWRKDQQLEEGWANSPVVADASSLPSQGEPNRRARNDSSAAGPSGVDFDFDLEAGKSGLAAVQHLPGHTAANAMFPLSRRDRADFALSMSHPARALKAEELFDVQQQADFFASLEQYDQAIDLLRHHIEEDVETSALVYLDLFNLYHQLQRQSDYEALREVFNQRFNANMPGFEFYKDASPGLEAHEKALNRIEALWPSPKVLDLIEESIFRRPEAGAGAFDLEAYRELLLLYAVAREIISPETAADDSMLKFDLPEVPGNGNEKTMQFLATSIQPLSASVARESLQPAGTAADRAPPRSSSRLGLDLDLSEIEKHGEATATSSSSAFESDSRFFAQFAADIPIDPPTSAKKSVLAATAPIAPIALKLALKPGNLIDFNAVDVPESDAKTPTDAEGKA